MMVKVELSSLVDKSLLKKQENKFDVPYYANAPSSQEQPQA